MGLQGRAGHGQDLQVHGVGWQNCCLRYRIQCVTGVGGQPRVRSLSCLQAGGDWSREVISNKGRRRAQLPSGARMGGGESTIMSWCLARI